MKSLARWSVENRVPVNILMVLLIVAGRATGRAGFFKGRPVLAVIASLFAALLIALLLQQFCKLPLDNTTTILLPIAVIVIGLVIAKFAPFVGAAPVGRAPASDPNRPRNLLGDDVPAGSADPLSDGVDNGDTDAWSDPD